MMYFFFFKQKTAYEMRISDWSSDVCSSDLPSSSEEGFGVVDAGAAHHPAATSPGSAEPSLAASPLKGRELADSAPIRLEIFNSLFMAIGEEMGGALQHSAPTINIRERIDFSSSIFSGAGRFVANESSERRGGQEEVGPSSTRE